MLVQVDGGYYTAGHGERAKALGSSAVGGQCGGPCQAGPLDNTFWYKDVCGSGGTSGSGGEIHYSKMENIFAFNGDMITNGDYSSIYYEYNKDGTKNNSKMLKVYERIDLEGSTKKFIPSKIFAQSGIIRATYTTNQGEYTLSKVKTGAKLPDIAKNVGEVVLVIATNEIQTKVTGYTNQLTPELPNQGIGSGAGYLEASNGTFEKIANP